MKEFKTTDKEYKMLEDFNRLYQAVYQIEDNENYWSKVVKFVTAYTKKYDGEFAEKLCISLLEELERRASEGNE